ncbi:MAG: response regulator transcription factor [Planctomycetota bacterium]|jgi:FixJ family two-component response regulator
MDEPVSTVYVVDDDEAVRTSITTLVRTVGLTVQAHGSAEEFLDIYDPDKPGCIVLDVRMQGMSGLELQSKLKADGIEVPIIFVTGHGDVPMAVEAVQNGAVGFVEKPFRDQVILDAIHKAIEIDFQARHNRAARTDIEAKVALLTPKEQSIAKLLIIGNEDKQIAYELGISRRAVAFQRAKILKKMEVSNVVELTALLSKLDISL